MYYTTDSAAATKNIQTVLDDTAGGGVANYYEADPLFDGATNNIHEVDRTVPSRSRGDEECRLDIRAADWEEHYDGVNEPPQYFLNCWGNTSGYIVPRQVSVEEIELLPSWFP